jgi:hypothetical protein
LEPKEHYEDDHEQFIIAVNVYFQPTKIDFQLTEIELCADSSNIRRVSLL